MKIATRRETVSLRRRLQTSAESFQRNLASLEKGDASRDYLLGLLRSLGEFRFLISKLESPHIAQDFGLRLEEAEGAVQQIYERDSSAFVNRIRREFEREYRGFEETLHNELTAERLRRPQMPTVDRTEFEYYALYLPDNFEYAASELDRLGLPLGGEIRDRVKPYEPSLAEAIRVVMTLYRSEGIQYQDRADFSPSSFWWRELAWRTYKGTSG